MSDGVMVPFTRQVLDICRAGEARAMLTGALKPYGKDASAFLAGIALYLDQSIETARAGGKKSIADCSPESVVDSVRQWADTGLSVNVALAHAHIVPFGQRATFVLGYKGLIALMLRSKTFDAIETHFAYPGEKFTPIYGTEPSIEHEPNLDNDGADNWIAVYAVGFKGKRRQFVCWSRKHVERFADKLRMKGPLWKSDFNAMARKTMVRRLADLVDLDGSPILTRDDAAEEGKEAVERVEPATVVKPTSGTAAVAAMLDVNAEPELPAALRKARDQYRKTATITGEWTEDEMRVIMG